MRLGTWFRDMALAHDYFIVRVYTDETLDGEAAKGSDTRALCLLQSGLQGKITYMR